jgi:pimeloyl-ACP methyl ester carboxylesterase
MLERHEETLTLTLPNGGWLKGDLSFSGRVGSWAVLFVHGFGGHRRGEKALAVQAACARRGWTFAAFDFRAHGESSGAMLDLRGSALLEDLNAVADHLRSRGIRKLGLVGSSMGGFASAWFAERRPELVLGCALIAPAFRFVRWRWDAMTKDERRHWKESGVLKVRSPWFAPEVELSYGLVEERDQFAVETLAARLACPLLIFHGLADETIPYEGSLHFAARTPNPNVELRLYKSGDHRLTALKEEMVEAACEFFSRCHYYSASAE